MFFPFLIEAWRLPRLRRCLLLQRPLLPFLCSLHCPSLLVIPPLSVRSHPLLVFFLVFGLLRPTLFLCFLRFDPRVLPLQALKTLFTPWSGPVERFPGATGENTLSDFSFVGP